MYLVLAKSHAGEQYEVARGEGEFVITEADKGFHVTNTADDTAMIVPKTLVSEINVIEDGNVDYFDDSDIGNQAVQQVFVVQVTWQDRVRQYLFNEKPSYFPGHGSFTYSLGDTNVRIFDRPDLLAIQELWGAISEGTDEAGQDSSSEPVESTPEEV